MELEKLEKVAESFGKTVNFLNSCYILPFVWCERSKKMRVKCSRKLLVFQSIVIAFQVVFLVVQSIRVWLSIAVAAAFF